MFRTTNLVGFGAKDNAGIDLPAYEYTDKGYESADLTTPITFSGLNFGTDSGNRRLVVCVFGYTDPATDITSVTAGGTSLTEDAAYSPGSTQLQTRFWSSTSVSGTSGDVVVGFNTSLTTIRLGVVVWAIYGTSSYNEIKINFVTSTTWSTGNLDVADNSIVFGAHFAGSGYSSGGTYGGDLSGSEIIVNSSTTLLVAGSAQISPADASWTDTLSWSGSANAWGALAEYTWSA